MKFYVTRRSRTLRGRAYFHALADAAGCKHSPDSVNRHWHTLKARLSPNRSRWQRAERGAELTPRIRLELDTYHPHLAEMFTNPIWGALNGTLEPDYWNALADTIQIKGRYLREYQALKPGRLFQRIDWSCICIYLVLWRTTSTVYFAYQRWVENNFSEIFLLLTLQLPMMHIRKELYDLLSVEVIQRIHNPLVLQLWWDWPERYLAYEDCFNALKGLEWLEERRDLFALLLWHLRPEVQELLIDAEEPAELGNVDQRLRAIRRRFHRIVRRCRSTSITINGACCTFGWPPEP